LGSLNYCKVAGEGREKHWQARGTHKHRSLVTRHHRLKSSMFGSGTIAGKYLLVWSKEPLGSSLLKDVDFKSIGKTSFIVGKLVNDGSNDPRIGLTYWFPVGDVIMLTEFDTMEQASNYMIEWKKSRREDFQNKP
jgi:hypothetical protein